MSRKLSLLSSTLLALLSLLAPAGAEDDGGANCTGCQQTLAGTLDHTATGILKGKDANGAKFYCEFTVNLMEGVFSQTCTLSVGDCGSATCSVSWVLVVIPIKQQGSGCGGASITATDAGGASVTTVPLPATVSDDGENIADGDFSNGCGGNAKTLSLKLESTKGDDDSGGWVNGTYGGNKVAFLLKCTDCEAGPTISTDDDDSSGEGGDH